VCRKALPTHDFGNELLGIEYSIGGKRIDVLLENEDGELLAVELKSGVADFKVFGQISMYIGLLMDQFPEKKISGVIIAGAIDSSLKQACSITDRVALKIYRMSIELDDA
jgi:RecB family endonuclease NucS